MEPIWNLRHIFSALKKVVKYTAYWYSIDLNRENTRLRDTSFSLDMACPSVPRNPGRWTGQKFSFIYAKIMKRCLKLRAADLQHGLKENSFSESEWRVIPKEPLWNIFTVLEMSSWLLLMESGFCIASWFRWWTRRARCMSARQHPHRGRLCTS